MTTKASPDKESSKLIDEPTSDGLIFAWEIQGNGKGQKLDWDTIRSGWDEPGLFWVHLNFEDEKAREWLLHESDIDESLVPYLISEDSRPGAIFHDNKLTMIMRGINSNAGSEPEDLISIRLYLAPDQIISMRRRRVQIMEDMSKDLENGNGVKNSSQFLIDVISRVVDRIGDHVEKLEEEVTQIERLLIASETIDVSDKLQEIQSELINLRRYLHPQRLMFGKLLDEELDWLDPSTYNRIRTQVEFHTRHVEDIDYCWQRTQVIKDELVSRQSERLNEKLYILAIVSCIFLPLTLITGLLGVNLAGIPFASSEAAFPVLTLLLLGIAALILIYFKKHKWF